MSCAWRLGLPRNATVPIVMGDVCARVRGHAGRAASGHLGNVQPDQRLGHGRGRAGNEHVNRRLAVSTRACSLNASNGVQRREICTGPAFSAFDFTKPSAHYGENRSIPRVINTNANPQLLQLLPNSLGVAGTDVVTVYKSASLRLRRETRPLSRNATLLTLWSTKIAWTLPSQS
eukprot:m.339529 g.339529  ORF g.339529 m.339529 type:complete len:175 (-) comp20584_c0_seq12:284-808(-)